MEIFPVSLPQITVPTQMSAPNDLQFSVPTDSTFKISEKSGPSSIDSFAHHELEESVISDSNDSHINSGLEEAEGDEQSSVVNEINTEGQAEEEEVIDPLMLAIYNGSLTHELMNKDDMLIVDNNEVEAAEEAMTINAENNPGAINQLEIPAEEILSEDHVNSSVDNSETIDANQLKVPGEEIVSEHKRHGDIFDNAAPLEDDLSLLEEELKRKDEAAIGKKENNTDLEYLFSEEEDISELKSVKFESEKTEKTNLTENMQDADPEDIHIRTDHGRQSKSGDDSHNAGFNENKHNAGIFRNTITTAGAGQFPPHSLIQNVEKLTQEKAPVSHIDAELVHTNAVEQTDAFTESSRSTGSIFTKNAARAAGFHEVLDRIVYVIRGNNRLGVNIEHDLLGKININLSMEKGMVYVHINTSEKLTNELIEHNLHYLMDELSREGVNVGGFSFGTADGNNEEGENLAQEGSITSDHETGLDGSGNRTGLVSIFA